MFNKNKYLNIVVKVVFIILDIAFFRKQKKLWVIPVGEHERFDGNIRAIYEFHHNNKEKNAYSLKIIATEKHRHEIRPSCYIKWGTFDHLYTLLNAGVIIYHHNNLDTGLIVPVLNRINYRVSHGIHYKKVERAERRPTSLYNHLLSTKYFLPYQAVSSKQDAMSAVCYFHVYLDEVDITGSAKNDIVIGKLTSNYYKIQNRKLQEILQGRKLITYAPTWRTNGRAYEFSHKEVANLESNLSRNNLVFGYAGHNYLKDRKVPKSTSFIDLNSFEIDIQILLRNSEILITDYSSVWIDYLLKDKPIILFQYDRDKYKATRDLLFDSKVLGIDNIVLNVDELICEINNNSIDDKHFLMKDYFHKYKDSQNTSRTIAAIQKRVNSVK